MEEEPQPQPAFPLSLTTNLPTLCTPLQIPRQLSINLVESSSTEPEKPPTPTIKAMLTAPPRQ